MGNKPGSTGNSKSTAFLNQMLLNESSKGHQLGVCQLMINGADPNCKDPLTQDTPLHRAILGENSQNQANDCIAFLLANGAKLELKNNDGLTPLLAALSLKREDIALSLVEKGAKVNVASKSGNTPLHLCAMLGMNRAAKKMISFGCKLDVSNNEGKTPFVMAYENNNTDLCQLLTQQLAEVKSSSTISSTKSGVFSSAKISRTTSLKTIDEMAKDNKRKSVATANGSDFSSDKANGNKIKKRESMRLSRLSITR